MDQLCISAVWLALFRQIVGADACSSVDGVFLSSALWRYKICFSIRGRCASTDSGLASLLPLYAIAVMWWCLYASTCCGTANATPVSVTAAKIATIANDVF